VCHGAVGAQMLINDVILIEESHANDVEQWRQKQQKLQALAENASGEEAFRKLEREHSEGYSPCVMPYYYLYITYN
jgi:hypothetical protein